MVTVFDRVNHVRNRTRIQKDIRGLKGHLERYDSKKYISYMKAKNWRVVEQRYVEPLCDTNQVLPINHSEGMFAYAKNLLEKLRRITEDDVIDLDLLTDKHAPDYVREFLAFRIERNSG